ncbi:MAG: hypothetical protein CVU74_00755 [Deltaproteobacteria bacterium HGW-Deltaproteobacteria-9]|nr:MAG: hypothetical protein CVU74_00755 [Deltaproteobacteria bacterium HGW-Deltaproteobacteria-9]
MKKNRTVNLKLSTFLCLIALFGSQSGAHAFCVQNETDIIINAQQTTNYKMLRGFTEEVTPGNKSCCSWKNDTCNKAGKEDSPTSFDISYLPYPSVRDVTICGTYTIPANGTIAVTGTKGNYRCEDGHR